VTIAAAPWRDRAAAALCVWILRHVATDRFRRPIENQVRHGLRAAARRASGDDPGAEGLKRLREIVANATDEDRARAARMMAHIDAQFALLPESHRRRLQ
jgi:hypothetical protein